MDRLGLDFRRYQRTFDLLFPTLYRWETGGGTQGKARREERRKAMSMAEQQRRHAAGRLLFWLHHAVANGDCSTELQEAMDNYQRAERKQKTLEQEILAVYNERIPD